MLTPATLRAFAHPILDDFARKIEGRETILVLPEAMEARVLQAARILRDRNLARVVLLGSAEGIKSAAADADTSLADLAVVNPAGNEHLDAFTERYLQRRPSAKLEVAHRLVAKPLFFGGSMLSAGHADVMLAGVTSTTARVIEASLMTVGLAEGIKTPSSCFLMLLPTRRDSESRKLIYADCAVNVNPGREELVDIALASAATARDFLHEDPRIAFLSFSTKGSGDHALSQKMREAAQLAAERAPDLAIDGELQADAALVDRVAQLKLDDPGRVAGRANVLIFPDLNAGNIAYKLTEHLAESQALGPFLQGFAHPVADVSRGATVDDIVTTAIVTMAMAKNV